MLHKLLFLFAIPVFVFSACLSQGRELLTSEQLAQAKKEVATYAQIFGTLPKRAETKSNSLSDAKIKLGKKLYFETALSKDGDVSCNSCHGLDSFGVDNKPVSTGHKNQKGGRNSPTVYNAALHIAQFWDGRASDVEEQALGPIMNPVEMAMDSEEEVLSRLADKKGYQELFKKAFPSEGQPLKFVNIGKAIGAFERTLITPSRFDDFLLGDGAALTVKERAGLKTFVESGCIACHSGALLGGHMYQKLGLVLPYETKDLGRYQVTKRAADKYFFKVPSLRNIARTNPYFHDGKVEKLEDAVRLMGKHQLGRDLDEKQVQSIITFLHSLTGELPEGVDS